MASWYQVARGYRAYQRYVDAALSRYRNIPFPDLNFNRGRAAPYRTPSRPVLRRAPKRVSYNWGRSYSTYSSRSFGGSYRSRTRSIPRPARIVLRRSAFAEFVRTLRAYQRNLGPYFGSLGSATIPRVTGDFSAIFRAVRKYSTLVTALRKAGPAYFAAVRRRARLVVLPWLKEVAPRRTGRLRKSAFVRVAQIRGLSGAALMQCGYRVYYARWVPSARDIVNSAEIFRRMHAAYSLAFRDVRNLVAQAILDHLRSGRS